MSKSPKDVKPKLLQVFPTVVWIINSLVLYGIVVFLSTLKSCTDNSLNLIEILKNINFSIIILPITTIIIPIIFKSWIDEKNLEIDYNISKAKKDGEDRLLDSVKKQLEKIKKDLEKTNIDTTILSQFGNQLNTTIENLENFKKTSDEAKKLLETKWIETDHLRKLLAVKASVHAKINMSLRKEQEKALRDDIKSCIVWLFFSLDNYPYQEDIKSKLDWYKKERYDIYECAINYIKDNMPKSYHVRQEILVKEQIGILIQQLKNI